MVLVSSGPFCLDHAADRQTGDLHIGDLLVPVALERLHLAADRPATTQKLYTLQLALRSIVGADNIDWSVLLSASVISLVPMIVLFAVFQRQIMNADLSSGLKD